MKATVIRYFVGFDREFKPGETVDLPVEMIDKLNSAGLGIILEAEVVDGVEAEVVDNVGGETTEWPKQLGGGYYELSTGEKVRGKDAAIAAQAEINASGS